MKASESETDPSLNEDRGTTVYYAKGANNKHQWQGQTNEDKTDGDVEASYAEVGVRYHIQAPIFLMLFSLRIKFLKLLIAIPGINGAK